MMLDLQVLLAPDLRRSPAMIALVILCTGVATVFAMRAPTTYLAEASMLVESPQIAEDLAESTVRTSDAETLELVSQQVLTRASLLRIAREFDVFEDLATLDPDDIVDMMQRNTTLNNVIPEGLSQRVDAPAQMQIAFEARTGEIAAAVVNEYVTQIVNANVELRTERAEGTLDFFAQEVERLSNELDLRSAQIAEFQTANADALPDQQNFRMNRLALLQERIAGWEREATILGDQRARLIAVFEATGMLDAEALLSPQEQELMRLELELAEALVVLSETNPRVQMLERRIEQMQGQVAAMEAEALAVDDEALTPDRVMLDLQLAELDTELAALLQQLEDAQLEIVELEEAITRAPLINVTLDTLQRDYDNVRRQYDNAVQRLAEASTGERIELTSRGQRITLIEPASVPTSPYSPNRRLIVAAGAALGLGLSGALFLILELLHRAVRRPMEITRGLGIQPLVTIPYIESRSRRLARRLAQLATVLLVLAGVPAGLWAIDTYYLPLDLLASQILDRLSSLI
jgi:uncharacterized protein involved in exopolysaccharide biosynthesis